MDCLISENYTNYTYRYINRNAVHNLIQKIDFLHYGKQNNEE